MTCGFNRGLKQRTQNSDLLRVGRSGDWISVGGEIFHTHPDWHWGSSSLQYDGFNVLFPSRMWPGCGTDHPSRSSIKVKETV